MNHRKANKIHLLNVLAQAENLSAPRLKTISCKFIAALHMPCCTYICNVLNASLTCVVVLRFPKCRIPKCRLKLCQTTKCRLLLILHFAHCQIVDL
jgi:hypothetical protein